MLKCYGKKPILSGNFASFWFIMQICYFLAHTKTIRHICYKTVHQSWALAIVFYFVCREKKLRKMMVGTIIQITQSKIDWPHFSHLLGQEIGTSILKTTPIEIKQVGKKIADGIILNGARKKIRET